MVEQQGTPEIELNKTVGTVPGVCATTNKITVPAGTEVYYCYQIENTGDVTLTYHSLVDTELGTLATNLPYALAPGAFSPQVIVPATIYITTTNVATWTAVSDLPFVVDDTIPYNWEDISTTGTMVPLDDDEVSGAIPIGFGFDYFGTSYTTLFISSNGFLTVLPGQSNGCCSVIPDPDPLRPQRRDRGLVGGSQPRPGRRSLLRHARLEPQPGVHRPVQRRCRTSSAAIRSRCSSSSSRART